MSCVIPIKVLIQRIPGGEGLAGQLLGFGYVFPNPLKSSRLELAPRPKFGLLCPNPGSGKPTLTDDVPVASTTLVASQRNWVLSKRLQAAVSPATVTPTLPSPLDLLGPLPPGTAPQLSAPCLLAQGLEEASCYPESMPPLSRSQDFRNAATRGSSHTGGVVRCVALVTHCVLAYVRPVFDASRGISHW